MCISELYEFLKLSSFFCFSNISCSHSRDSNNFEISKVFTGSEKVSQFFFWNSNILFCIKPDLDKGFGLKSLIFYLLCMFKTWKRVNKWATLYYLWYFLRLNIPYEMYIFSWKIFFFDLFDPIFSYPIDYLSKLALSLWEYFFGSICIPIFCYEKYLFPRGLNIGKELGVEHIFWVFSIIYILEYITF